MIELEHNGERYMVDGGKWYRRLKVGEVVSYHTELRSEGSEIWHKCHLLVGGVVFNGDEDDYRVPCTDPRPPFVVGQRVKVARGDGDEIFDSLKQWVGHEGRIKSFNEKGHPVVEFGQSFSVEPWCLDAVEPTFGEKIIDRMEKFTELLEQKQKEHAQ